ncbi:MAG: hypothetical protein V3R81_12065 [Gammaproteobacteria bacterium]
MIIIYLFAGALFALAILALITVLIGHWLGLTDRLREITKTAALDLVQIYSSASQAQIDAETRRSKLDYSQELAQLRLAAHQRQLPEEVER